MVPEPDLGVPADVIGLQRIDHVGVATRSIADAYRLYHRVLGGRFMNGGDNEPTRIRTLQVQLPGGMKVELLQPTDRSSYLAAYLDKHGEGMHHLTLLFDDVEQAIARFEAHGYELVDTALHHPGWRETYVRPRCASGTLLQLADSTLRWDVPLSGITAEDVLDGRVVWDEDTQAARMRTPAEAGRPATGCGGTAT